MLKTLSFAESVFHFMFQPSEFFFVDRLHTDLFSSAQKIFVLADSNTAQHCLPEIEKRCEIVLIEIQAGEKHKNIQSTMQIWQALATHFADRNSLLVNVGGGMVCDIGGFAASTFMRGIPFIHVPTTLLAMADAAHGHKTGIDLFEIKNMVGTFAAPLKILIYPKFLRSLPPRELLSGLAEVLKHYIIADASLFHEFWKSNYSTEQIITSKWLLERAIQIKLSIVQRDPLEKNIRKTLNFGHTVGHALESYFLNTHSPLLHGEAVALGMFIETQIAHELKILPTDDALKIETVLLSNFLFRPAVKNLQKVMELMLHDKKNKSGVPLFSLPNRIGNCLFNCEVPENVIINQLQSYNERYSTC